MNNFVIGVGSQRAGSTLLHRVLDECTNVFMHPVKELHYYDTLFDVRHSDVLVEFSQRQLVREVDRIIQAKAFGFVDKKYRCMLRTNRILAYTPVEKIEYIDLYRPCIAGAASLGEVTPEYMVLPEEAIQKLLADLGSSTKIILISRDPVERFVSAFKLLKSYNNPEYNSDRFSQELEDTLETMPGWVEQQRQLNDYEQALTKYEKYFDDVLFLSLEKMIHEPMEFANELEVFLDQVIDKDKVAEIFSQRVNSIAKTRDISADTREKLAKQFESNTDYLKKCFGENYYS